MADLITNEGGGVASPNNAADQVLVDFDGAHFPGNAYGVTIQNLHATLSVEVSRVASFTYGQGIRIPPAGGSFTMDEVRSGKLYVRTSSATAVDTRVLAWRKS